VHPCLFSRSFLPPFLCFSILFNRTSREANITANRFIDSPPPRNYCQIFAQLKMFVAGNAARKNARKKRGCPCVRKMPYPALIACNVKRPDADCPSRGKAARSRSDVTEWGRCRPASGSFSLPALNSNVPLHLPRCCHFSPLKKPKIH